MKFFRKVSCVLTAGVVALSLCACSGGEEQSSSRGSESKSSKQSSQSEPQETETPTDNKNVKTVKCSEQDFSTVCAKDCETYFAEDEGLYIHIRPDSRAIPYVLIYRVGTLPIDIGQYIEEVYVPDYQESYGEDLAACSIMSEYDFAGGKYDVLDVKYRVRQGGEEYLINSFRVFANYGGEYVSFIAKYIGDDEADTKAALETAIKNFSLGGVGGEQGGVPSSSSSSSDPSPAPDNVRIRASEAASVKYVNYSDPNGYFTMQIPEGWDVHIGFPGGGAYDAISYPITLYDPSHHERKAYFCLASAAVTSEIYSYTNPELMISKDFSVEGFFKDYGTYLKNTEWGYSNFKVLGDLGQYYNGKMVSATCTSSVNGIPVEGIFAHGGSQYLDVMQVVNYYDVTMITAAAEDAVDWIPVMTKSLGTLKFTQKFDSDRAAQWHAMFATASYISSVADETRSIISSSWEERNRSYDIISQKNSDATLGYERVYDTETGEIYKAANGFTDVYSGTRYKPITENMYADPIAGYIEF